MRRRVVITGLGVINALGYCTSEFWHQMLFGRAEPAPYPGNIRTGSGEPLLCYPVVDFAEAGSDEVSQPRVALLGLHAAQMALADAGLHPTNPVRLDRFGIAVGSAMGAYDVLEAHQVAESELTLAESFAFSRVGAMLAHTFQAGGPNLTVSTACAASGYGISLAHEAILEGRADVMLTGGYDARTQVLAGCFHRLGALDSQGCRPFDRQRKGTVFGEGAALLVLEAADHAAARGHSHIYGEILGTGWSCDGFHVTAPEPAGTMIERSMRLALLDAGLAPHDIDCVLVHGTGTPLNDATEGQALVRLFGDHLPNLTVTATKSKVGHLGGAAAALSCATAMLMLEHGLIPPTANLVEVDERCGVVPLTGSPRQAPVRTVMINAYAFGGNNISLIVGKPR